MFLISVCGSSMLAMFLSVTIVILINSEYRLIFCSYADSEDHNLKGFCQQDLMDPIQFLDSAFHSYFSCMEKWKPSFHIGVINVIGIKKYNISLSVKKSSKSRRTPRSHVF